MNTKKILLLSDIHIGHKQSDYNHAKKIFEKIAQSHPGVPTIITGDLTDSATLGQFKKMRALLDILAKTNPVLSVPGNHDYAWKGNICWPKRWQYWEDYLGKPLGWPGRKPVKWMTDKIDPKVDGLGIWKDGPCVYFGIDSGDPNDKQVTARGYISKGLASALETSLKSNKGKTRIAFLHHHPFDWGVFTKLDGSKRLLKALKNNCELTLFGHKHKFGIWNNKKGVDLIVSSHKTTDKKHVGGGIGYSLFINIIEIDNPGSPKVLFRHSMELIQL
jgi:3',5'-cyclic AMP phosphodiesterase CpdA